MGTKLEQIAEIAKTDSSKVFTALAHHLNKDMLRTCHKELNGKKATGVKGVTKAEYEENLEENLENLIERLKLKRYIPQPVKRVYIAKPGNGNMRSLGIPEYEDKIVQKGISKILNAIYEQDFLDCSFGFRPNRNCHDALKLLGHCIETKKVSYVVDVDIQGFFDNLDHKWLMKFLEHRIGDPSLLRIIGRILKSGAMEDGKYYKTETGTPQGGVVSPILANVYLHYVLDLWFFKRKRKEYRGDSYMIRYADDFVCCFQHEDDAVKFLDSLKARLGEFGLSVNDEKTKIINFGRFVEDDNKRDGGGKPPTFDFLGFTHYCGKSKYGKFRVKRKTSRKKETAKIKSLGLWLKWNRNKGTKQIIQKLNRSLTGYYNYYCITDNIPTVKRFLYQMQKKLYKWLNRRSQRKSLNYEKFNLLLERFPLVQPKVKVNIYELKESISLL